MIGLAFNMFGILSIYWLEILPRLKIMVPMSHLPFNLRTGKLSFLRFKFTNEENLNHLTIDGESNLGDESRPRPNFHVEEIEEVGFHFSNFKISDSDLLSRFDIYQYKEFNIFYSVLEDTRL